MAADPELRSAAEARELTADARDAVADSRDRAADERDRVARERELDADLTAIGNLEQRRALARVRADASDERAVAEVVRLAAAGRRRAAKEQRSSVARSRGIDDDGAGAVAAHAVINSACVVLGGLGLLRVQLCETLDPESAALIGRMEEHAEAVAELLRDVIAGRSTLRGDQVPRTA